MSYVAYSASCVCGYFELCPVVTLCECVMCKCSAVSFVKVSFDFCEFFFGLCRRFVKFC